MRSCIISLGCYDAMIAEQRKGRKSRLVGHWVIQATAKRKMLPGCAVCLKDQSLNARGEVQFLHDLICGKPCTSQKHALLQNARSQGLSLQQCPLHLI